MTSTNHGDAEPSLESLIERSAELKGDLVDFACGPRLQRHLTQFMRLRRRKPWYYDREPRPGFSVIGTRLAELAALR